MELGVRCHTLPALLPGKRTGTHFTKGWVGPRAGLDGYGKSRLHRDSIPGPSTAVSESLYRLSYADPKARRFIFRND
jgi:hypothetical protein